MALHAELLNHGGFGKVEKITNDDGSIQVRKTFDPRFSCSEREREKLIQRFKREVKVQRSLNSNYFIPIINSYLDKNPPYFIMPYCESNFLDKIMEFKRRRIDITNDLSEILNAIEQLHSIGFIHRDLKPQNILFHDGVWKLTDFGLVRPQGCASTMISSAGSAWGTESYCSPEQIQEFRNVDARTDIYAFGCILHDIYSDDQRIPYRRHSCHGPIGRVVEKCTETSSDKRFNSVSELRNALFTILSFSKKETVPQALSGWRVELDNIPAWNSEKVKDFERYLRSKPENELEDVFSSFDEQKITILYEKDAESWSIIIEQYCEWIKNSGFPFAFCDVLADNLSICFNIAGIQLKSFIAISLATMAYRHNRWYAMKKLLNLCGHGLDDHIADRIAIEITVEDIKNEFIRCCSVINLSVNSYHPKISFVLNN